MVRTHTIFFSIAIFCLVPVIMVASVSLANPEKDLNALPEETAVARVLDKTITLGDINPSKEMTGQNGADMTDEQLTAWKAQIRTSNLGRYFRILFEQYAEQSEITVTDAEIDQYNQAMLQNLERQAKKVQVKAESLEKELQAQNMDDAVRNELTEKLEIYTRSMKQMEELKDSFQNNSNPIAGTVKRQAIRQWKTNQCLYKQYGGRVIYQQAGPEPLDAYRNFLEERQQQGDFEFYNEQAADLLWEYYRNDKMHTFTYDESKAKKMMETEWWLQEPEETLYQEDMDLWGDCTDGLCSKIMPKSGAFTTDKDVTVTMDLLNIGQQTYRCASDEMFFEVEVDGNWYSWSDSETSNAPVTSTGPDTIRYEFARLVLTKQWHSIEDNNPLALDEGSHYLRVRYQPMGIMESEKSTRTLAPTFWITSNLQTFSIIPIPLMIVVEGETEIIRKVRTWLSRNPRIVEPVIGQSYQAGSRSLKSQSGKKTIESGTNFTIKIMDASGNRKTPQLEQKLTELILEQMQE